MFRLIFIVLLAIFTLTPTLHSEDNANYRNLLSKHYRIEKPEGAGPFPAVLLVSGSRGFDHKLWKKHYNNVQDQLVKLGFVTLRVNYLAARNVASCSVVPTSKVADDICIAAEYLGRQTFVKKGAINVIGWSWGGASAFQALRNTGTREPAKVDAVVAYFPHCSRAEPWDSEVPVLFLGGALDNVSPFKSCEWIFSRLPKRDKLTVRVYDDAPHYFDNPDLPAGTEGAVFGSTLGYNEAAAKSAWIEVTKFLQKSLS